MRWPAGLHAASGSGVAYGGRPIRPPAAQQENYWRRTATELFAAANSVLVVPPPGIFPLGAPIFQRAYAGPSAAGEQWEVRLCQVALSYQYNAPPLATQQQSAQARGTLNATPPPIIAQAWLSAGGVNIHLLAQTTQGSNDTLDLGGQVITAGEAITVLWWSTAGVNFPGTGWMALRGTRHALSVA